MQSSSSSPDIVLGVGVMVILAVTLWFCSILDPALGSLFVHMTRQLLESGAHLGG